MVQDEEQMSTKEAVNEARAYATEAKERFWNTWDLVATEQQRAFLLRVGAIDATRDNETRSMDKPSRRQEYRKLCRLHLDKELAK